ncbi:C39 family peptidase [Micromonospora echinofusca]|uniref:Phytochelatin synthase n=1 Tax=Micromonospora echinofusca TaxID=47858 RepID=A0ABS3VR95_MICEH|nr:C39 family peptidase [Micromonospora echinofusca]MBO4207054.1 phytochelatin synthase [Micromonospora echinofusca]
MTTITRTSALTIAGLAVVGGAIAGPATAVHAATTNTHPTSSSDRAGEHRDRGREVGVRYEAQPNFYYCGPASTRIALTAQGKNISQDDLARQLGTTEAGTNSAVDITRVLNKVTGDDEYTTVEMPATVKDQHVDKLRGDMVRALDDGRAVVANIAGTATDTDGVAHSYEGGHYLSVVGYRDNGDTLKIADPANPDQASYWITAKDLADWTATRGYSA